MSTFSFGCTDSQAINYDPFTTIDDSSCVYKMTYVPDDDFENLLESFGFGDVNNDSVFTHHLQNITYIAMLQTYNSVTTSLSNNTSTQTISNLTNLMISDLTGIEDFSNLEGFNLGNMPLDSIDLSSNMELRSLHIYNYPNSFTNYINLNPSVNLDSLFLVGVNISDQNFHNAFIPTMESTGHVEIYNCSFVNLDLSLKLFKL